MSHPKEEKTLVLVKPDGVKRGLVGEIISRLENRGLKIVAMKLVLATKEQARDHYPNTETWLRGMGEKSLENYQLLGKDPVKEVGTADSLEIGKMIAQWGVDFLTSGPMLAIVVQGLHAIPMVRKIVGNTLPSKAEMGTIRGDYSVDSAALANADKRALHNLVHASGDPEEASHEIPHWFSKEEIHSYKRAEEDIMF